MGNNCDIIPSLKQMLLYQIRRAFRNIRRTIFGILNVLVLLLLAIGLFALLATKLFENR
jgi:uncharacterized protein involved in exopolysaccharide biosynthesis